MKTFILAVCLGLFSLASHAQNSPQVLDIQVTEEGFSPDSVKVNSDSPVILNITRKTDNTCATEVQIKDKKIKKELPLNQTVKIELGKLKKGKLDFACGMNMIKGQIKVD